MLLRRQESPSRRRNPAAVAVPLGLSADGHHAWAHSAAANVGEGGGVAEARRRECDSGSEDGDSGGHTGSVAGGEGERIEGKDAGGVGC
jgi:hypothetical protein